jgi:hypothetical protein
MFSSGVCERGRRFNLAAKTKREGRRSSTVAYSDDRECVSLPSLDSWACVLACCRVEVVKVLLTGYRKGNSWCTTGGDD